MFSFNIYNSSFTAGWSSLVARGAHNPKVAGSNPAPAILFYLMAIEILNDKDFEEKVIKSSEPVIIDLWAEWCHPCKMIEPHLKALSEKYNEKIKFYKLNVDENPKTPSILSVMSIPTLIFFKNGKEVGRIIGAVPKSHIEEKIKEIFGI